MNEPDSFLSSKSYKVHF